MTLSPTQTRFLALHVHHRVERWTWHFGDTMLCAITGRGRHVYLWADELRGLLEAGLMFKGAGCADVHATDAGREWLVKEVGK